MSLGSMAGKSGDQQYVGGVCRVEIGGRAPDCWTIEARARQAARMEGAPPARQVDTHELGWSATERAVSATVTNGDAVEGGIHPSRCELNAGCQLGREAAR